MEIILVRHGKPEHKGSAWCTPRQMGEWVKRYNQADVGPDAVPHALVRLADQMGVVLSSSQQRCRQSLAHLTNNRPCLADEVFGEAHLPYLDADLPMLPVRFWRFFFRLAWFCGLSSHTESIARSNRRASEAARQLIELAETHESVMLMGHGIMNILIAHQLRRRGWRGPALLFLRKYWHASTFRKSTR